MDVLTKNKLTFVSFISVILLAASSVGLNHISKNQLSSAHLKNGLDTCYKRSFQSLTARLINDGQSAYLQKSFISNTTVCYDELQSLYLDTLIESIPLVKPMVVTLLTRLENYHENLTEANVINTPANLLISNIGNHFEKVEKAKDNIDVNINKFQIINNETYEQLTMFFYILAALCPLLILSVFVQALRSSRRDTKIDNLAFKHLSNNDSDVIDHENIFETVLTMKGFNNTVGLFRSYVNKSKLSPVNKVDLNQSKSVNQDSLIQFADIASSEHYKNQLDSSWKTGNESTANNLEMTASANLYNVFLKAFDTLASRLIDSHIDIDYGISKKTVIKADLEVLEQIICESLSFVINKLKGDGTKELTVNSKNLGGSILIEFKAISQKIETVRPDVQLPVLNEFLQQINGEFKISSTATSLQLLLILVREKEHEKALTYIGKGKKKDLLKSMQATKV